MYVCIHTIHINTNIVIIMSLYIFLNIINYSVVNPLSTMWVIQYVVVMLEV